MKEVYAKTLAGLIGFSRQPACTLPQIADECEVYVYNTPPQAKKSMAPLLSEKLYTYREKFALTGRTNAFICSLLRVIRRCGTS